MLKESQQLEIHLQGICRDRLMHCAGMLNELATGMSFPEGIKSNKSDVHLMDYGLRETAGIVKDLAQQIFTLRPMENRKGKQIIKMLRLEGIIVEQPCYYPLENELEGILLTLSTGQVPGIRGEEVADMLSVLLGTSLQLSLRSPGIVDREKRSFLFVPQAPYIMLTGFAKAAKEGEAISGDSLAVLEQERGQVKLFLSDGTGCGEVASESSGWVLDMMERLLDTGYSVTTGAEMVNSLLLYRNSVIWHPTLDVCEIDLYAGKCCFYKAGGSRSFLKREHYVEEIHQENLPLGLFEKLELSHCEKKLWDGDYLIMVSDGIMEVLLSGEYEDLFLTAIQELTEQNPQVIAEKLLQMVIRLAKGRIEDDMTILVAGIWEKSLIA